METPEAVLFFDLVTRDGRRTIELRRVVVMADGALYASARATFYSCAYDSQSGRIAAFSRAVAFCNASNIRIRTFEDGERLRAAWQ